MSEKLRPTLMNGGLLVLSAALVWWWDYYSAAGGIRNKVHCLYSWSALDCRSLFSTSILPAYRPAIFWVATGLLFARLLIAVGTRR